jgi:hypothetical protein
MTSLSTLSEPQAGQVAGFLVVTLKKPPGPKPRGLDWGGGDLG